MQIQFGEARVGGTPGGLKNAICQATLQVCAERWGRKVRAIVLTGSLARDEATFVRQQERWVLWGDAEFLLIFDRKGALPSSLLVFQLEQEIEQQLLEGGICAHVELSPVYPWYLRTMPPEIFAYELRTCGQVIWGEPQILSLIPDFSASDIPLEDGWRMLCNRMVECEMMDSLAEKAGNLAPEGRYSLVKLYLDMATSFLLFQGRYAATYLERAKQLKALSENKEVQRHCPFSLQRLADRVDYCTKFKLQGGSGVEAPAAQEGLGEMFSWTEIVAYARGLWRWELEQLTGTQGQLSDCELMTKWMQLQPVHRRLRGWASALRRCTWSQTSRHWPHWIRLGWRASPRNWVYAAASEIFFRLPDLLEGGQAGAVAGSKLRNIRSCLPVARNLPGTGRNLGWREVAADIAWNYRRFLKTTRS